MISAGFRFDRNLSYGWPLVARCFTAICVHRERQHEGNELVFELTNDREGSTD